MPKGALSIYDDPLAAMEAERSAYLRAMERGQSDSSRSLDDQISAYQRAYGSGPNMSNMKMAAAFFAPTRTGTFGESLSGALNAYADSSSKEKDSNLERMIKLAQINEAKAKLAMGVAGNRYSAAKDAMSLPQEALKARGMAGAYRGYDAGNSLPPPPSMRRPQSLSDVVPKSEEALPEYALGGVIEDEMMGNEPMLDAEPSMEEPAQVQLAQAAPVQQTQQMQQGQGSDPFYPSPDDLNWAKDIYGRAIQQPELFQYNPKAKAYLERSQEILKQVREARKMAMEPEIKFQIDQRAKKADAESKRLLEIDESGRDALKQRSMGDGVRAARKNLLVPESVGTGGGQWINRTLDFIPGVDSGAKAVDAASGQLKAGVVKAQNSGAISNIEQQLYERQVPGMGMGASSTDWTLKANDAIAKRQEEQAQFYRAYKGSVGSLDGADQTWSAYVQDNPVIASDSKTGQAYLRSDNLGKWQRYIPGQSGRGQEPSPARTQAPQGEYRARRIR